MLLKIGFLGYDARMNICIVGGLVVVLRIDHISIKGMLLGVWQVSHSGKRDAIVEKMNRCFVHKPFFANDRSRDKP